MMRWGGEEVTRPAAPQPSHVFTSHQRISSRNLDLGTDVWNRRRARIKGPGREAGGLTATVSDAC